MFLKRNACGLKQLFVAVILTIFAVKVSASSSRATTAPRSQGSKKTTRSFNSLGRSDTITGAFSPSLPALFVRGGSTREGDDGDECVWLLQQLSLRQQRLAQLSKSLDEAGFVQPTLVRRGAVVKVPKSWDCTVAPFDEDDEDEDASEEQPEPLSCLIMGEVLPGFKAVAPSGTGKWVTLRELNKMRRHEPQKVSGLWYEQFQVNCASFSAQAGPPGQLLSFLLDKPSALRSVIGLGVLLAVGVLRQPLGVTCVKLLTSATFWKQHLNWSRIIYAPLPAKIYFAQIAWAFGLAKVFSALEHAARESLIEAECDLIEFAVPETAQSKAAVAAGA